MNKMLGRTASAAKAEPAMIADAKMVSKGFILIVLFQLFIPEFSEVLLSCIEGAELANLRLCHGLRRDKTDTINGCVFKTLNAFMPDGNTIAKHFPVA